jgi:hypothetical protein
MSWRPYLQDICNRHTSTEPLQDCEQGVMLGDSGYACRPYLLTPFRQPRLQMKQRFNRSHISTRSTIEGTFSIWKQRFRMLHTGVRILLIITKMLPSILITIVFIALKTRIWHTIHNARNVFKESRSLIHFVGTAILGINKTLQTEGYISIPVCIAE